MHREGMNGDPNPTGASPFAPTKSSFGPGLSSRASPFPTTVASANDAMAAPAFLPPAPVFRPSVTPQSTYPLSVATANPYERDANATNPVGTPYSATSSTSTSVLIRKLPANTEDDQLRMLMAFSNELVGAEFLPPMENSEDSGFRSALLKFSSVAGAQEAKNKLHGKSIADAALIVEIVGSSPGPMGNRFPIDTSVGSATPTASSSSTSPAASRQAPRYNGPRTLNGGFQSLDGINNGIYGSAELANPDSSAAHYQNLFSPQSPIGNHLSDNRTRISGKSLINDDTADDDETGELIKNPIGFAENGLQRRQTAPQIPISRMANLSLTTTPTAGPSPMSQFPHPSMASLAQHQGPSTMSPTVMGVPGPAMGYNNASPYRIHNFPPANPADQNPPCNTLYVGNLPAETSEEELKAMFSKQRGYKRLCFRTKQNGPMCFVEFEDISFATKALNELYGQCLHNSVKGGIRLSFSKNPLGVRSGQTPGQNAGASGTGMNGAHPGSNGTFTTANGPPPGLSAPPGLVVNRVGYSGSPGLGNGSTSQYTSPAFSVAPNNPWGPMYNRQTPMMATAPSTFPPHMMGR